MFKNFVIVASLIFGVAACSKATTPVETPDVLVAEDVVSVPSDSTPVVDAAAEVTETQDVTATQVP